MTNGKPTNKEDNLIGTIEEEFVHIEREIEDIAHQPAPILFLRVLKYDLPYIVMLSAAILGIGYTSFTGEPIALYWEIMAPTFGLICIWAGWRHVETNQEKVKLVWTQALHWAAVVIAEFVVYTPEVRGVANNNAASLSMMTVLALATFLAGVHTLSWQVCIVGVILALSIPAIAWITTSAVFLVVALFGLLFIIFVITSVWWTMLREKKKAA